MPGFLSAFINLNISFCSSCFVDYLHDFLTQVLLPRLNLVCIAVDEQVNIVFTL